MNTTRLLAAAFVTSIGLSGTAFAQARLQLIDPPSTIQAATDSSAKSASLERGHVRTRTTTPNWGTLNQLRETLKANPEAPVAIDVPMFADTTLALTIDQAEVDPASGTTTYYGHADNDPLQSAVIVERNGSFALHVVRGSKGYQVILRGDHHEAAEVDRDEFTTRPDIDRAPPAGHPSPTGAKAAADVSAAADDGSTIDLMVVYSDRARMSAGGTAAIENQIALAVGTTNQAYVNSGMIQRLRLVHTVEIANSESADMEATLMAITQGTAPFQGVNALRNQYGADMVSMWVESGGQYCGIGWVMDTVGSSFAPYAYNVNDRNCAISGGTMAHELGHNMGLEHDLYVSPEGPDHPVAKRYAHGYVNTVQRFRTIMAYSDACTVVGVSCPRINQFSDPGFTFNGAPTGNATTADASRMLDETRVTVANFRPAAGTPPPPPVNPTIALAQSAYTISEGSSQVTLTVTRTGSTTGASTVAWTTANGTAVAGSDFGTAGSIAQRSGTLTFAAGETSKTITVPIVNDTVVETNETFTVKLSSPSGAVLGLATATVTITDNDTVTPPPPPPLPSTVQFSAPTVTVSEGARTLVLSVIRVGPIDAAATVRWSTANGTATAGQDFGTAARTTQYAGTISWRAMDGAAKTISIPILDDTLPEGTETFTVTLSSPSVGITLGSPSTTTVSITDNDGGSAAATELRFSLARYQVSEAAGSVVVTVNRVDVGGGFGAAASVSYATQAGSALAGSDFVATSGTLTWAAGDSAPKTITIPIVNNTVSEGSEIFTVNLSGASASTRIGTPSVQVLILDDEVRTR